MPSTGRRQTRPRPCFSPGGHGENACLLRRCSPRSWSQPAPSVTMIPMVWPGWEIPWGSDLVVGAVEPSPSPGRSPAGQLGPPASGGGGSLLPLLHVPSVGVIACQPGEAAIPPRAVPSGARRSRKAGGQGGGHPLLLAVSAPLHQSLSRELRASALCPGLEAQFPARRREERGCGPVTGKDRAARHPGLLPSGCA